MVEEFQLVQIKSIDWYNQNKVDGYIVKDITFVPGMSSRCSCVYIVRSRNARGRIALVGDLYSWSVDFLTPVNNKTLVNITI